MTSAEGKLNAADSLASSKPSEVLIIDNHGNVMSTSRQSSMKLKAAAAAVGVGVSAGVLAGLIVGNVLVGAVFGAGLLGSIAWTNRYNGRLRAAMAAAASGDLEDARARLDALNKDKLPTHCIPWLHYLRGKVSWQEGKLSIAKSEYEQALAAIATKRNFARDGMYWILKFDYVQLTIILGDKDNRAELLSDLDKAPAGDYLEMEKMTTHLLHAFYSDAPDSLPDDETLYGWATDALGRSRFGMSVVLLAWAFHHRGDHDMSSHLQQEAPERMRGEFLDSVAPEVFAWWQAKKDDDGPTDDV